VPTPLGLVPAYQLRPASATPECPGIYFECPTSVEVTQIGGAATLDAPVRVAISRSSYAGCPSNGSGEAGHWK